MREAIQRAIDFEGIKAALGGLASPAGMILGRTAAGWDEELDRPPPYDPEAARRLLAEAGYPDGFDVALDCPTSREAACRFYPEMLARIGIKVDLRLAPAGEVDRLIHAHASDFFHWGWADPLDSTSSSARSTTAARDYAAPGVASPELDALIDAAEAEPTTFGRDELIGRIWKRVLGEVLYVPTYRVVAAWVDARAARPANRDQVHGAEHAQDPGEQPRWPTTPSAPTRTRTPAISGWAVRRPTTATSATTSTG